MTREGTYLTMYIAMTSSFCWRDTGREKQALNQYLLDEDKMQASEAVT